MRIAFISPKGNYFINNLFREYQDSSDYISHFKSLWSGLSTGLLVLAALTRGNHDIEIIDENIENIDFENNYDLVGISFMTQQAVRAYEIADKFRKKGVKVILGGIHTTVLPDEAAEHADSILVGEAEYLWPEFMNDLERNSVKKVYRSDRVVDLKDSPVPRYDLIKDKKYKVVWMQTTRGCPHDCEFCAASKVFGNKYRKKTVGQVMAEVETIIKNCGKDIIIGFSDDNFLVDEAFSVDIIKRLIPQKIKWIAQTDIAVAGKDNILKLLKESGCVHLLIGFESVSEENLKDLDKYNWKSAQLKNYGSSIDKIQSCGVGIMGSFIIGLENDDLMVFRKIEDFILKHKILEAQMSILTPLPGTRLRERMEKENRLLPLPWNYYTFGEVVFRHKKLSKEELEKGLVNLYKHINKKEMYFEKMEYFKNIYKNLHKKL
jgi:radical SAM superfamily enzyme YgiQ (UPF0313 family)